MSDKNRQFVGRANALNWLRRKALDTGKDANPLSLLLVHGDEGVGKSALVEHFLLTYTGNEGLRETVNFVWKDNMKIASMEAFSKMLLASGDSCLPELQKHREILDVEVNAESQLVAAGNEEIAGNTYTIHGASRDIGLHPVPLGGEETILADEFVKNLASWLGAGKPSGGLEWEALLRLIFVFDAFDTYPTPIKSWLGQYLLPALEQAPDIPPMSVILTGRLSWESGGQADYWQASPGAFHQFSLDPLSRQECEEYMRILGIKMTLLDLIYEETEGYPGRILHAANDKNWLERKTGGGTDPENPLSCFTAQERRWLHAASMDHGLTLEALQLLLGRVEGTQAFGWLSRRIEFCQVEQDYKNEHMLVLSGEMRDTILKRMIPKVPARHREFTGKISLMKQIRSKVESAEHRGNLRILTPLQPFNRNLIREVLRDGT